MATTVIRNSNPNDTTKSTMEAATSIHPTASTTWQERDRQWRNPSINQAEDVHSVASKPTQCSDNKSTQANTSGNSRVIRNNPNDANRKPNSNPTGSIQRSCTGKKRSTMTIDPPSPLKSIRVATKPTQVEKSGNPVVRNSNPNDATASTKQQQVRSKAAT